MKFGYFSHVWNKPDLVAAGRYQQLWRELALADQLGFDYSFCVEHHFSPGESWMPSPPVFCTGGAARTERLRMGPMGYVVPLYDPLRIVEDAGVLDNILEGRLELGLVSGIVPRYFTPFKADFPNRRALTLEAVKLVKAAFASDGPFSFEGEFHQYQDINLSVKPLQKPYPPLWLQSRDPATLEFLAAEGVNTGYLFFLSRAETAPRYREYLRRWTEAGHAHKPNIGYWTLVYVDETDQKARDFAAKHIVHTFCHVGGFGDVGGIRLEGLAENFRRRNELGAAEIAIHLDDPDYLFKHKLMMVGSPRTVAEQLHEAACEGLFNTFLGEFNIGFLTEAELMRSVRLFGEEVLPELRDLEPY